MWFLLGMLTLIIPMLNEPDSNISFKERLEVLEEFVKVSAHSNVCSWSDKKIPLERATQGCIEHRLCFQGCPASV